MTEAVMSAGVLRSSEASPTTAQDETQSEAQTPGVQTGWSPAGFAREQIRGLVQQVFFCNGLRPLRQVVFNALEPETDVRSLCWRVGETLALETSGSIAIVGVFPRLIHRAETRSEGLAEPGSPEHSLRLREIATRVRGNLWLVPHGMESDGSDTAVSLASFLSEVRRQFDYSIVQGPAAGKSNRAAATVQCADGVVLVLSAQRTRRAAARSIKQALEATHARILGTVLSDRVFPIPEAIYRRL